jgi:succinoglycan biosynthesis transport protein ExoP
MRARLPASDFPVAPQNAGSSTPAEWIGSAPRTTGFAEPEGIPWSRYVDALSRHSLLVLAVALVGSIAGFVVTRLLVKPTYDAEATIWINATPNSAQQPSGPIGPIRQQQLLSSYSWVELLRSFAVVDPVVRDLKLNVSYSRQRDSAVFRDFNWTPSARSGDFQLKIDQRGQNYVLSAIDGTVLERGVIGDSVGRKVGFRWLPDKRSLGAGRTIEFGVDSPRSTSASLVRAVHPTLPENGQFLKITLSGGDAPRTARTVNAWAEQLVSSSSDLKKRHLLEFKRILADQLAFSEAELRSGEQELERFRVATITLPAGSNARVGPGYNPEDPVLMGYFQRKAALDELRSERDALERMIANAKGGPINTQGFLQLPAILNSAPQLRSAIDELSMRQATLRTEQQFLTDANPRIKQLAEAVRALEIETIPRITADVLNSLKAREPDLTSRIEEGSQELRAIPVRTTEEMRLARRVAASENLYNSLKARYGEVSIAEAETTPDLAVLDTAVVPTAPSSNEAPRYMLLSALASLGLALALALILDRFDPRFRYPEQATRDLGLLIAGTVPRFKANRRGEFQLAAMSQAVESYRTLRLALLYDFPDGTPIVLAVSSPSTGDGKSLVSSNLGLAFASAGSRTLLIDGDVRRGTLHSTFDTTVTPGLVDYLHGQASADSIVRSTASENLFLIPRGTRRIRAPELLVSELMNSLVNAMRLQFDVVIIDSPPLVAGIDAYALGAAAGSMLIVLRPEKTDRKLAAAKLEILDRLPIRILGAVLNAVPDGGAYRYYGADYSYNDGRMGEQILDLATPKGLALRA